MLIVASELAREVMAADPLSLLAGEWSRIRNTPKRWLLLREAYREHEPRAVACEFEWDFTPIERNAWDDIKALGLPFYPQYPVGRRFVDFADPKRKIGIETDGRAYHDRDRDLARDAELEAWGWRIFHIQGRNTFRLEANPVPNFPEPEWDPEYDGDAPPVDGTLERQIITWGSSSSIGFFWALEYVHYSAPGIYGDAARTILRSHELRGGMN